VTHTSIVALPCRSEQGKSLSYAAVQQRIAWMQVIDEIQHLLSYTASKHRAGLNAITYLANQLRISIVATGTRGEFPQRAAVYGLLVVSSTLSCQCEMAPKSREALSSIIRRFCRFDARPWLSTSISSNTELK
jgi:hypothetical protein